ncbi:alternate-type signal peptide domain-containing protein [Nocardioides sp. KIGAM211]|uniref:Alternate-type signal peptide domain-containing protein n=1 Tax=Nocardioides luti TaxID=2761101 RepID=A0A7X0RJM6_9ACTN|nr:alternate-type signal peptide domain-containing protein [Nocardioides luti]MBB6629529.1 alternate-type signal peptide domain-containing protein [Nocardioides luti]
MKKATKGALAAAAAGSLMLGGAGSLAYWTSTSDVNATNITSGHLKLVPTLVGAVPGTECGSWKLDSQDFDPATGTISPGDVLSRTCTYSVDMVGSSLSAKLDVAVGALTGDLGSSLSTAGTRFTVAGGSPVTPGTPTTVADGNAIVLNLEVKWADRAPATDNTYNSNTGNALAEALATTTVSLTQDH